MSKSKGKKLPPKKGKDRTYTYGAGGRTYTARYPTPSERRLATKRQLKPPGGKGV
jgi:hypothetical protein